MKFRRIMENINWRLRRRAVRKALNSLRKNLALLSQPGADVDSIGLEIYRDCTAIEINGSSAGTPGGRIWI